MKTILALCLAAFVSVSAHAEQNYTPVNGSEFTQDAMTVKQAGQLLWGLISELWDTTQNAGWCGASYAYRYAAGAGCLAKFEESAIRECWAGVKEKAQKSAAEHCGFGGGDQQ